ncbi:MAG TPA: hypothetical protein VFA59_06255 [Vicinamibacterales bacterium]|nr:hypothetical protein [Vicinamibacterales bacterium]
MPRHAAVAAVVAALGVLPQLVAAQTQVATAPAQPSIATATRTAARAVRGQTFSSTIQGNALNSTNGQLSNTLVRLRDARFGRIVDTVMTDKTGLYAFKAVDPGSYIVEILSADKSAVMAASQILNVNAGDVVSAVVKLPFKLPPFAGILGGGGAATATPTTAAAVVSEAAASSVLVVAPPPVSAPACELQH